MTKKPQIKREVAINSTAPDRGAIRLFVSPDAAETLKEFGEVISMHPANSEYVLLVDGRFDFDEIVEYIENYGKEEEEESD